MIRRLLPNAIAIATVLAAWPSVAADDEAVTGLTNTGIGLFIVAIACALLLTLVFRATAGHFGRQMAEKAGAYRVRKVLRNCGKNVLDDFILPGAYDGLTRIDHAILTSGGIICIQTKHYNGVVFGDPDEPQWTNVDGTRRQKFLNPLIQNEGRAKALQKISPEAPVANLVVFTGTVQFTSARAENVLHIRDLDAYIEKFVFGSCKIEDWDAVWMTLRAAALVDEETRKDFNAQLSFS